MEITQSAGQPIPPITYNPDELSQIVSVLCHCTEPEEIILFGSLAEATPFSEITAYDLFVLTANRSPDDWNDIRSYRKFKLRSRIRTISFINLYICSPADVSGDLMLFYRFIQANGKAVYSRKTFKPKPCDYERLYFDALDRYELFFSQADGLFEAAEQSALILDWRRTAFQTACGVEMLLHALYAAYHAADCNLHKLTTLFLRMQTLSPDLFILLDPERGCSSRMLSRLDGFREKAMYKLGCAAEKAEINEYLDRSEKMKGLIEKICTARLALYKSRITPTT